MSAQQFLKMFSIVFCAFAYAAASFANPVLNNVAAGQVTVQQTQTTTTVNQTSQKAIINWNSFNIGAGEHTHFQQPQGGVALNRINPTQGVSEIYGKLTATGQVILVNPAGFHFGPGSYVNVGGLIASTASISDEDFLNSYYRFTNVPGYNGAIVNQGHIIAAEHGLVALIGGAVRNDGTIEASMGTVAIGAGREFTIAFAGDDMIQFSVDGEVSQRAVDRNGNQLSNGVDNRGAIIANGGRVLVSSKAARGVLDRAVNTEGLVRARSVSKVGGEVVFGASANSGVVRIAGNVDASGRSDANQGGSITVTGENILLDASAILDVSGNNGGGEINIGGNYLGQGPLPNANAVVMQPGAQILADAIISGDGGKVILWSDNYTNVNGYISTRGGNSAGSGGFIETSSKNILNVGELSVDTSAMHGATGTWLLDPYNISITTSAMSNGSFDGGNPDTFVPTGTANIFNSTLNTNLDNANVVISTAGAGADAGDVSIAAPISWSSGNNLTINADGAISSAAAGTITASGGGILTLNTASGSGVMAGVISGSLDLVKTGAGTLSLTGSNSYSGGTSITGGTLILSSIANAGTNSSIGTGSTTPTITINGGTFQYLPPSGLHVTNRSFSIGSNGATINTSRVFYLGSSITGVDGDLELTGTGNPNTLFGSLTLGSGSLLKSGTTTWFLNGGLNSYTGTTTITNGQLTFSTSMPNTDLIMNGPGTLDVGTNNKTISSLSGNSAAASIVSSGGTLTIDQGSDTTFSGGMFINTIKSGTGTLSVIGQFGGGRTFTVNEGAISIGNGTQFATINSFSPSPFNLGANGNLILNLDSSSASMSARITGSGSVTKVGTGTVNLTNTISSYTGATNINGGTLSIASIANGGVNSSIGAAPASTAINLSGGGILAFTGGTGSTDRQFATSGTGGTIQQANAGTLTLSGAIGNSGTTLTIAANSGNITASGVISGVGGLAKSGNSTLILSGNNTYAGSTNITAGTLQLGASEVIPNSSALSLSSGSGMLNLNNFNEEIGSLSGVVATSVQLGSGTLTSGGNNTSTTFAGVISGSGNIIKVGIGTHTLSGANVYTGNTAINNGTVSISSDANLGAAPGVVTANSVTLNGGTLQTTSTLTLDSNRGITLSAANNTIDSASGVLTYNGLFSGANGLSLNGAGSFVLGGDIGGATPLSSLTVNADLTLNNSAVTTSGSQQYNNNLMLTNSNDINLTSQGGSVTLSQVTWTGSNALNLTANNSVNFNNRITATNGTVKVTAPTMSAGASGYLDIHNIDLSDLDTLLNVTMSGFNDGVIRTAGTRIGEFNINNNGTITGNPLHNNTLIPIPEGYQFLVRTGPRSGFFTNPFVYLNFLVPDQPSSQPSTTATRNNANNVIEGIIQSNANASNIPYTEFVSEPEWILINHKDYKIISNLERPVVLKSGGLAEAFEQNYILPANPFQSLTVQIQNDVPQQDISTEDKTVTSDCMNSPICSSEMVNP